MKVIRNRHIGSLLLGFALLGCQASQKPEDRATSHQEPSPVNAQGEASEAVVGPDEAFFAAQYLEQVFQYSRENASPTIIPGTGWLVGPATVSAFDYRANFTETRLQLMSLSLLMQGDLDKDGALAEAEFSSLRLNPDTLGLDGETLSHSFDRSFFERVSGSDELLQAEECENFLRDLGPLMKGTIDRVPLQDQRRQLQRAWEKVLARYDNDQSGSLSLTEQRELRKDRSLLISRLTSE